MPEYVAAAAASLAPAGSIASTVIYATTYVATVAAIGYGANALAADLSDRENPGQLLDIQVRSDAYRQIVVGERLTAGSLVGRYITGPGNNNLVEVIALADHRLHACKEIRINGITQLTNLVHGVRTSVPAYRSEPDRLWVTWYDGRHDQTADAVLAGYALTNQPDWTTNHRGRGVSYLIVEMQWDDDVMLTPVTTTALVQGGRWYDRRKDSTAGGVGSHRHMDNATWEYTTNPDVFADHYQLGIVPYPNAVNSAGKPLYSWGVGLKAWQLPFDRFKEQADISDETVTKKDGVTTHARYALNAIFDASSTHRDILMLVAKAKAGRVVDIGGRLSIVGREAKTPVMTLYDDDLVKGEQSRYTDKLSISELSNVFRGTFPDPLQGFRPVEYPKIYEDAWINADGGDELQEDVSVEVDTDEERVQRLVWLYARDKRRQARLTEAYGPWAMEIQEGDWFERVGARFPSGKLFEATRVEYTVSPRRGMYVVISSKEVDADDVAWDADTASNLSRPEPVDQEAAFAAFVAPVLSATPTSIDGTATSRPALLISWSNADDPRIRSCLIEYALSTGGPVTQLTVEAGADSENEIIVDLGIADDVEYLIHARYQGIVKPSAWSNTVTVTTGDTYIVGEADSVAWSAVYGAGKPDDNADVTLDNTAAAITGQDYGATAPESAISNALVALGGNMLVDTDYRLQDTYWSKDAGTGSVGSFAVLEVAGLRRSVIVGSGVTIGSYVRHWGYAQRNYAKVQAGDKVGARVYVGGDNISSVTLRVQWRDDAGALVATSSAVSVSSPGAATGDLSTFTEVSGTWTAPAGATTVNIDVRGIASTSAPTLRVGPQMLARIPTTQTVAPLFAPGREHEIGANVTETRVAASILGQGSLALLNSLAYGSGYLSGFGVLASLGSVSFGGPYVTGFGSLAGLGQVNLGVSGNVYREDGSTRLTDAIAVTSLGVAASIFGQGSLALLNSLAYGGSYLTGFGTLAPRSDVYFGSSFITETSGGTQASLANFKTILGVASSITGQGALATLAQAAWATHISGRPANLSSLAGTEGINNALVPMGANGLVDTAFRFQSTYWDYAVSAGSGALTVETSTGGLRKSVLTGTGAATGGSDYLRQRSLAQRTYFQCKQGDKVGARILAGGVNIENMTLDLVFRNAAGTQLQRTNSTTLASVTLDGTGEETTLHEFTVYATAPANAVTANLEVNAKPTTSAPVLRIAKPMLAFIASDQTVVPAFTPGREHEVGANVTETRVAASITGQGSLALLSSISYGSAYLSGFGSLAALSTITGLAAGSIVGQGWGATASEAQASNAQVPAGANALVDTAFRWQTSYWTKNQSSGSTAFSVETSTQGLRKCVVTGAGVTTGGTQNIQFSSFAQIAHFPCKEGDKIAARALIGSENLSQVELLINFRNASGTPIGNSTTTSLASGLLDGTGEESTFNELTNLGVAPAGTACASVQVIGRTPSTAAPVIRVAKPLLARVQTDQTVAPLFSPGREHEIGANVTETRVAASITSQGAFATLSSVAYGSGYLTGFGSIAALSSLAYGSGYLTGFGTVAALSSITGLTAGGITGQGSLATANSAAWGSQVSGRPTNLAALSGSEGINNAAVPIGVNALFDTQFRFTTTHWASDASVGSSSVSVVESSAGLRKYVATGSGVTVGGGAYVRSHGITQRKNFPCKPGDTIAARCLVGSENASEIQLYIMFRNAAGTLIGTSTVSSLSSGLLSGSGEETTFNELTSIAVAPASTETANIDVRAVASTTAPVLRIAKPVLTRIETGQTAVPQYVPGGEHEQGANVTETRVAASITGQGSLALLNSVAYGSGNVTGFGSLAALAFTTIGTNTRRADGTTVATESMLVTSLGVASSVTGQGAFATLNSAAYGSALLTGFGALAPLGAVYFGSSLITETSGGSQASLANFKTSLGVAASITGQGWGATASQAAADNNLVPAANITKQPSFQDWSGTYPGSYSLSGTVTVLKNTTNHIYGAHVLDMDCGATANAWLLTSSVNDLRITAAQQYMTFEWEVELVSGDFKRCGLMARQLQPDTSNRHEFKVSFHDEHGASPAAGRYSGTKTVAVAVVGSPSGTVGTQSLYLMMNWASLSGGADSAKRVRWHRVNMRPATQQEISALLGLQSNGQLGANTGLFGTDLKESAGVTASLANFKTSLGVASSITSQGSLATRNTVASTHIDANAVTFAKLTDSGGHNLQENAGFELGLTGWSAASGLNTTDQRSGTQCYATAGIGSNALHNVGTVIPCSPGEAFRVSGWGKSSAGATGQYWVRLRWYNTAGTSLGEVLAPFTLSTTYNFKEAVGTAPANTAYCRMNCYSNGTGTFYWDDLCVTRAVEQTLLTSTAVRLGTNVVLEDGSTSATNALVVTSSGVASSISGQGGLATLSFVTIGTNLRLANGTTVATETAIVTSMGVASSVTGQGALATLSIVNTTYLSANSVTQGTVDEDDTQQLFNQTWTAIADVTVTTPDANTLLFLPFSAYIESSGQDGTIAQARIKRDSTVIYETDIAGEPPTLDFETPVDGTVHYAPTFNGQVAGFDTDSPGAAGTYTYTLEFRSNGTGSNPALYWSATRRRFLALMFKR